jgi:hypothetical protein
VTSDDTAAGLWAAIEADLSDAAPKLILADYLQERDLDPDAVRALRWWATIDWVPTRPEQRPNWGDWHVYDPRLMWPQSAGFPPGLSAYVCTADKIDRVEGRCGCCADTLPVLVRRLGRGLEAVREGACL